MKEQDLSDSRKTELTFYAKNWMDAVGVPAQIRGWKGTTLLLAASGRDIIIRYRKEELDNKDLMRQKLLRKLRRYYKELITPKMTMEKC